MKIEAKGRRSLLPGWAGGLVADKLLLGCMREFDFSFSSIFKDVNMPVTPSRVFLCNSNTQRSPPVVFSD